MDGYKGSVASQTLEKPVWKPFTIICSGLGIFLFVRLFMIDLNWILFCFFFSSKKLKKRVAHTHTPACQPLTSSCVYKKVPVPLSTPPSLSSAVLPFCNFSGVTANWCELREKFAASLPSPYYKLEPERGKSGAGGKEKHGEKMEKREKTGGMLLGGWWEGRSHFCREVSFFAYSSLKSLNNNPESVNSDADM